MCETYFKAFSFIPDKKSMRNKKKGGLTILQELLLAEVLEQRNYASKLKGDKLFFHGLSKRCILYVNYGVDIIAPL